MLCLRAIATDIVFTHANSKVRRARAGCYRESGGLAQAWAAAGRAVLAAALPPRSLPPRAGRHARLFCMPIRKRVTPNEKLPDRSDTIIKF